MKTLVSVILLLGLLVACDTNTAALPTELTLDLLSYETQGTYGLTSVEDPLVPQSALAVDAVRSYVFPSTNKVNGERVPQWAHVAFVDATETTITLDFVQPRAFGETRPERFEYRIDDEDAFYDTFAPGIEGGNWRFVTVHDNENDVNSFTASSHVDVRMTFGPERDERFDWTRFYVMPTVVTEPETMDDCKDGGFEAYGFKNQGQCIQYVNTEKDKR